MGNMVQANSICAAFTEAFGAFNITISPVVIGVIVAAVAAFVFLGGTQRLASVVEKVVPIMAGVYIVGSLILIIMNIANLPAAIKMIFVGAFDPQAVPAVQGAGAIFRKINGQDFFDPAGTGRQDQDAVSHADGLRQVMGYQYGGLVCLAYDGADVVAHRQPGLVIQG